MSEEQQGIYEPEEIPNDYGDMGRGEVDDSINDDLRDQAYNEDDIFEHKRCVQYAQSNATRSYRLSICEIG